MGRHLLSVLLWYRPESETISQEAALPWIYLKGVSTGEIGEALKVLVGYNAQGLSANTFSRLKSKWSNEYQHWWEKPLDEDRWVYIWSDVWSSVGGFSSHRKPVTRILLTFPIKSTGIGLWI